jgi:hypothetical protein
VKEIYIYLQLSLGLASLAFGAAENQKQPQPVTAKAAARSMMPMPLVAPLFIEDDRRASIITMVNDAPSSVDVDIVLLDAEGDQVAKQTVTIDPRAIKMTAVADVLTGASASWPAIGSIVLEPHRASTMAAQLSISGRNDPSFEDLEEEFSMMMDEKSANFRAVADSSAPVIAVRSLSSTTETITIRCLAESDKIEAVPSAGGILVPPNGLVVVRL